MRPPTRPSSRLFRTARLHFEALESRATPSAGTLDPTFGTGGRVSVATGLTWLADAAVDSLGRTVVVGSNAAKTDIAVVRFLADGTRDAAFGTKTISHIDGTTMEGATAVAIGPNDTIVVASSYLFTSTGSFNLAELDSSGNPVTAFQNNGKIEFNLPGSGSHDYAADVAVNPANGDIVVVGSSGSQLGVARLPAMGAVAPTSRMFQISATEVSSSAFAVVFDATGKLDVAATTSEAGVTRLAVAQLNPADLADIGFGRARLSVPAGVRQIYANGDIDSDPTGNVYVASNVDTTGALGVIAVTKVTTSGTADAAFGTDAGTFLSPLPSVGPWNPGARVRVKNSGMVLLAGNSGEGAAENFALLQLTPAGALDRTFNAGGATPGTISMDFAGNQDFMNGFGLDRNGRAVLAGTDETTGKTELARVFGDTVALTTAVGDGTTSVTAGTTTTYTITVTNAGPNTAPAVPIATTLPATLTGVTFTSTMTSGVSGNTAAGNGPVADVVTLPSGGSVTYTLTGTVSPTATGNLVVTATVTTPAGVFEADVGNNTATDTDAITPPPPPPTVVSAPAFLAVGGTNGSVPLFAPNSAGQYGTSPAASLTPFAGFTGQVRTASGDVNNDGFADTVVVTGPGVPIRLAVVSGQDNRAVLVAPFDPFGGGFTGGGFVAAANLDGQGGAEFIVTPDQGGGPRVTIFSLTDGAARQRANFFGIDDPSFRGGARAAAGDVNGDGTPDLTVCAGFLGGPRTALFDGTTLFATPTRLVSDFFAFPGSDATTLRNGVFVAAGDVNGDGRADLIFGGGPGGAPRVFILSGATVAGGNVAGAQAAPIANFFVANNSSDRGGVRLAVKDADGDGKADVVAGSGEGSPAKVRVYLGANFTATGEPATFQDLIVFGGGGMPGGVFVG